MGRIDKHLLALLVFTFLINIPLLSPQVVFLHDTLNNFIFFHFTYSELYLNHEFPLWVPLYAYGIPIDQNLLFNLQPTDYVAMIVGLIFRMEDALLLFKLSAILSQTIFVLGLYLLARRLTSSLFVVWMVCLGGLLTNSWFYNSLLNFTVFYLLPLVFYFLIRFLESGKAMDLWLAGLIEVLSLLGTITYVAPLHLLMVLAFLVPCCVREPRCLWLFMRWRIFVHPLFFVFVLATLLIGDFSLGVGREVTLLTMGRDSRTGTVSLLDFRTTYGKPFSVSMTALLTGNTPQGEKTVFMGLLPLALWMYGLVRRRDTMFLAFTWVAVVLLWFAAGGWFSELTYYAIPLMNRFRNLGVAFNLLKVVLLMLGGLGLDQLLRDCRPAAREIDSRTSSLASTGESTRSAMIMLIIAALCLCLDLAVHWRTSDATVPLLRDSDAVFAQEPWAPALLVGRFVVYAIPLGVLWSLRKFRGGSARETHSRILKTSLAGAYLADVGLFYALSVVYLPWCPADTPIGTSFHVHGDDFSMRRIRNKESARREDLSEYSLDVMATSNAAEEASGIKMPVRYASAFLQARVDIIEPFYRLDAVMPGVKEMFEARGGKIAPGFAMTLPPGDENFAKSLGDLAPKIRLVRIAIFADNDARARQEFSRLDDPFDQVILIGKPPPTSGPVQQSAAIDEVSPPHVFTANRMKLRVSASAPAWLFCADAYHPGWQATVNGERADVLRANLGCKAVRVGAGKSEVDFYFDGGLRDWLRFGIALLGAAFGLVLTISVLAVLVIPADRNDSRLPARSTDQLAVGRT